MKSTVAVVAIDVAEAAAGLLPQPGLLPPRRRRFRDVFRLNATRPTRCCRPTSSSSSVGARRLADRPSWSSRLASVCWRQHCIGCRRPIRSTQFKARFEAICDWLADATAEVFHLYSFATLRQFGACYELAATYLHWLDRQRVCWTGRLDRGLHTDLSTGAKTLQFHLARAMARKKPLDLRRIDDMARDLAGRACDDLKAQSYSETARGSDRCMAATVLAVGINSQVDGRRCRSVVVLPHSRRARSPIPTSLQPPAVDDWLPATVPGTVAAALRRAGRWDFDHPADLDASDWWYRTTFAARRRLHESAAMLLLRRPGDARRGLAERRATADDRQHVPRLPRRRVAALCGEQ